MRILVLILGLTASIHLLSQCPSSDIILSTQEQVDEFFATYPGCASISQDLVIVGNDISNLDPLNGIVSIDGNLDITGTLNIYDLDGLETLTSIGGNLNISTNTNLISPSGLWNLQWIGGTLVVYNNEIFVDFIGLSALNYVGGITIQNQNQIGFLGLDNLSEINGNFLMIDVDFIFNQFNDLEGINTINGSLGVVNTTVENFDGLSNVSSINGFIQLDNNQSSLSNTDLSGLAGIDPASIQELIITNNSDLSYCSINNFCDYLAGPGLRTIQNNSTSLGCNSSAEVLAACAPQTAQVAGIITTPEGQPVEGVTVVLSGAGFFEQYGTNADGSYFFEDIPLGDDYNVFANFGNECNNCIEQEDLVLLTNYVNGVGTLDPYQLIRSDINQDNVVNLLDLEILQAYFLGGWPDTINPPCYRFVVADYVFPDPSDPFNPPFPEVFTFNNIDQDETANFYALGIGDVGGCSENTSACQGLSTTVTQTDSSCCYTVSFETAFEDSIYAFQLDLLHGAEFEVPITNVAPGFMLGGQGGNSVIIHLGGQPFPAGQTVLFDFCLTEVLSTPQAFNAVYYDETYNSICIDTFNLTCPIENYCLEVVPETPIISCDEMGGYAFNMTVNKPEGGSEAIGLIEVHLTAPASVAGTTYSFSPPPMSAGDTYNIEQSLPSDLLQAGDSLCLIITGHDDPEKRFCCFADSLCLEVPSCIGCEDVTLRIGGNVDCCFEMTVNNLSDDIDFFTEVNFLFNYPLADFASITFFDPAPWTGSASEPNPGNTLIHFTAVPGANTTGLYSLGEVCFFTAPPDEMVAVSSSVSDVDSTLICADPIPELLVCDSEELDCDSLFTVLVPQNDDPCCYDVLFSNSVEDPTIGPTSLVVALSDGPNNAFSQAVYFPPPMGWNAVLEDQFLQQYTFTHPDGVLPLGDSVKLMEICIASAFSTDSSLVEVSYLTGNEVNCVDSLSAFCPGCLSIESDTLYCENGYYDYRFTFTNFGPIPVNAVGVMLTDSDSGDQLSPVFDFLLPEMVEVGETYDLFIPLDLADGSGDGEVCVDIVLRQIDLDNNIDFFCCFATHCINLPPCDSLPTPLCEDDTYSANLEDCFGVIDPVCGCDGVTYDNLCYAYEANVGSWVDEACFGTPPEIDWTGLPIFTDDKVRWEGSISLPPDFPGYPPFGGWDGFILEKINPQDDSWWIVDRQLAEGDVFLLEDDNPIPGQQVYRVRPVSVGGQPYLSANQSVDVPASLTLVALHPNPVDDQLFLSSNRLEMATVSLISATSRQSLSLPMDFSSGSGSVELRGLAPGLYFIRVQYSDGTVVTERFVKK